MMAADQPQGLWAWMTKTHNGEWGLIGVLIAGFHTPMVFGIERVAKSDVIRAKAQAHADATGQQVKLMFFKPDGLLEAIDPTQAEH